MLQFEDLEDEALDESGEWTKVYKVEYQERGVLSGDVLDATLRREQHSGANRMLESGWEGDMPYSKLCYKRCDEPDMVNSLPGFIFAGSPADHRWLRWTIQ